MSYAQYRAMAEGERVVLRILEPADASERYARWLNDPVVNQYLETRTASVADLRRYIGERDESSKALFFGIFWKETGEHIGNVKLEPIDTEQRTAVMGMLIGEKEFWGKGVATEVTNLIVSFSFDTLGLRELSLGVLAKNTAARRVYKKCGFEAYRVEKQSVNHNGTLHDHLFMRKKNNEGEKRSI